MIIGIAIINATVAIIKEQMFTIFVTLKNLVNLCFINLT